MGRRDPNAEYVVDKATIVAEERIVGRENVSFFVV
jgi:hypothetical protein